MRTIILVLALALAALQYGLWVGDDGMRELRQLEAEVAARTRDNATKAERNAALEGEVADLKQGLAAIEERARNELGMVGRDETFYLITSLPERASRVSE